MSRLAYDGISADARVIAQVIQKGDLAFYYADGLWTWTLAELDLVRDAGGELIAITVTGDPDCAIADVENGDLTPKQARGYVRARRSRGRAATIYCNRDTLTDVRAACAGLDYDVILADPTGHPHQAAGTVGVQWFWGPDYDKTTIWDDTWYTRNHFGYGDK